jgi:hypothetical protein
VLSYHSSLLGVDNDSDLPVLRVDGTTGRIDMLLSKARKPRASELEHLVVELKGLQKK